MKKEIGANGEKDENVFDIQQGVSINIFIRKKGSHKGLAEIYHADLFGKRSEKYDLLSRASFGEISWEKLSPNEPFYFFMKRDENYRDEYEQGFSIESLMPEHTTGVVTARDGLVIDSDRNRLLERIRLFADASKTDDETREYFFGGKKEGKYLPGDSRGWSLAKARQVIRNNNHEDLIQKIAYRPFDVQYIYYTPDMVDWGRDKLMANFLNDENIGLVIPRQAATDNWSHVQLTKYMADNRIHYSNKGIPIECPLYIYKNNMFGERVPNINKDIADDIGERIGVHYVYEEKDKKDNEYSPVDLIDYIYAILFSPKYRKKYLEFLKFDFPKGPYPKSADYFWRMVKYGKELRKLHLEESEEFDLHYEYCGEAVITIEKPYFENEKIFLNRVGAYISNVPESVWNMYFGGYQPLQKWLKDRKNTEIDEHGISHLRHMITVLSETEAIMQEIDNEIEA